jgi:HEAT repeat protein
MSKRFRIRIMLILLSVCALGAIGLYPLFHMEPSFEGRHFSDWIWTMNEKEAGPEKEKARAVVRQLGTNSIPLLLGWLRQEDRPSWTGRFDELRHTIFFWLVRHKLIANRSITSLQNFNPSHSAMAMWALPELDHAGRTTVIPTLIQMLGEKEPKSDQIARAAGGAHIVLSKMAPESIAPLIEALSSQDVQVWALAASALGKIGPDAKAAIPILEKRFKDKDPIMRVSAAGIIGKLGGDPDVFIPVVIQNLPEVSRDYMDFALEILLRYKEHAKAVVPVLVGILNNATDSSNTTNVMVRGQVIEALSKLAPESIAPLIEILSSHDVQVWKQAARALGEIGPDAKAAIPVLEKKLEDKDLNIRVYTAEIMGKLGGDPRVFVPVVIQSLTELDWNNMTYALDILVRYKESAKASVPVLMSILNDTADSTNEFKIFERYEVIKALRQIDPAAAAKVDVK